MSCENNPSKASRAGIKAGIAQLAAKSGYYAGLALKPFRKVAGMVGAARRMSDSRQKRVGISPGRKPVPQLSARTKVRPFLPRNSDTCTTCKTAAGNKRGSWYSIGAGHYCQDCAPGAAYKANVDFTAGISVGQAIPRLNLKPAGSTSRNGSMYVAPVANTTWSPVPKAQPLPLNSPIPTRLAESRVGLAVGRTKTPVIAQGYVLLADSRLGLQETGLAVTPAIEKTSGQFHENRARWSITHIASGMGLTDAVYSLDTAQNLGSVLAQLDWTRDKDEIPIEELYRTHATVKRFNEMRAVHPVPVTPHPAGDGAATSSVVAVPQPARADTPATRPAVTPQPAEERVPQKEEAGDLPRPTKAVSDRESIAGNLVADGYGGLARVIEDNGDMLFLVDSTGTRYELPRHQTRTPDEFDFTVNRVARPFEPAAAPDDACARCGHSAGQAKAGETWHKMDRRSFCGHCASDYAGAEGYCLADEINTDQEPII